MKKTKYQMKKNIIRIDNTILNRILWLKNSSIKINRIIIRSWNLIKKLRRIFWIIKNELK